MSYKTIADIGELGLIDRIASIVEPTLEAAPSLVKGIGDDCAVYEISPSVLQVSTTDLLLEHVHFDLLTTPLHHLGSKAISVNVSDICAMNARPRYALISIALPPKTPEKLVEMVYSGMSETARMYRTALAGGDSSASTNGIILSVTLTGDCTKETITYRTGAHPGDMICVTGALGGSAAGLRVLMREKAIMMEQLKEDEAADRNVMNHLGDYTEAIRQHLLPAARVDIIDYFSQHAITPSSMIDISDGLASDLAHICRCSGVGAEIEESRLPIHAETRRIADEFQEDPIAYALAGGEDYQLLFTLPTERFADIASHPDITVIGKITAEHEVLLLRDIDGREKELHAFSGYDHFGGKA